MNVALLYLFNTIFLPVLVTFFSVFILSRRVPESAAVIGLGLGFIASFSGVFELNGLWGTDATRFIIWGALITGLSTSISPLRAKAVTAIIALTFGLYLCLSPLSGMWREGLVKPLLNEWMIGAWLSASITLLTVSQSSRILEGEEQSHQLLSSAHFASLALSYAIAAPCVGLSGSASMAQLLGALGLATATVGLIGLWRKVRLTVAAYCSAYTALFLTIISAHFYLTPSFSSSVATLIIFAPMTVVLTARWRMTPLKRVIMSLVVAAPLLLIGLGLVVANELSESEKKMETDEFGVSY